MALGDAILACLTEHPMTGYELAKTFDSSIGFFWKADHQQIYRELSKLRDRGPYPGPRGRAVRQAQQAGLHPHSRGPSGAEALGRPAEQPAVDQGRSPGAAVRAGQRRHRAVARRPHGAAGTPSRPVPALRTHPQQALPASGTASPADTGKLLSLRIGLRHERAVAEWCEEAIDALSAVAHGASVVPSKTASARTTDDGFPGAGEFARFRRRRPTLTAAQPHSLTGYLP